MFHLTHVVDRHLFGNMPPRVTRGYDVAVMHKARPPLLPYALIATACNAYPSATVPSRCGHRASLISLLTHAHLLPSLATQWPLQPWPPMGALQSPPLLLHPTIPDLAKLITFSLASREPRAPLPCLFRSPEHATTMAGEQSSHRHHCWRSRAICH
jgi:hypothetical protein